MLGAAFAQRKSLLCMRTTSTSLRVNGWLLMGQLDYLLHGPGNGHKIFHL